MSSEKTLIMGRKQRNEGQSWKDKANGKWMKKETLNRKIDPTGVCEPRVIFNSVLCRTGTFSPCMLCMTSFYRKVLIIIIILFTQIQLNI